MLERLFDELMAIALLDRRDASRTDLTQKTFGLSPLAVMPGKDRLRIKWLALNFLYGINGLGRGE